jgi:outer membrane biosynthesis protein TonB
VLVKTDAKQVQAGMPTFLWLLILILMVVVALVVGYAVGRKGSNPPPEDPYQAPGHRADAEKGEKWEELKDESARNDPQEGMEQPVREETPPPAPAEEPKPEETPAEEPKAHEKPAEELKPEEKPADEPKAEEKPAEEPRKDDTKSDLDDLIKKLGT